MSVPGIRNSDKRVKVCYLHLLVNKKIENKRRVGLTRVATWPQNAAWSITQPFFFYLDVIPFPCTTMHEYESQLGNSSSWFRDDSTQYGGRVAFTLGQLPFSSE